MFTDWVAISMQSLNILCKLAQSYCTQKTLFPTVQLMTFSRQLCKILDDFSHSFAVVIQNDLCIQLLEHLTIIVTMLSLYDVKLGTFEITDVP